MLFFVASAALAADPSVSIRADGTVVGEVVVAATEAEIRSVISDQMLLSTWDPDTNVRTAPDGACTKVWYTIPHPLAQMEYTTRACPTDRGLTYTLTESDDVESLAASWEIMDAGEGRHTLRYSIRLVPTLPIPQWIISRQASQSVLPFLSQVQGHLER